MSWRPFDSIVRPIDDALFVLAVVFVVAITLCYLTVWFRLDIRMGEWWRWWTTKRIARYIYEDADAAHFREVLKHCNPIDELPSLDHDAEMLADWIVEHPEHAS